MLRIKQHTPKQRAAKHNVVKKKKIQKQQKRKMSQPRQIITNNVYNDVFDMVGNTPLVKINFASRETGCNIYGKCEFTNPGGSVKDRAALGMIQGAEARGDLIRGKPGIILDATAGNTGIALTLLGTSRGYRTVIVIPETQTAEKKATLRAAGAYLIESGAFPFKDPRNYVHVASRLHKALKKVLEPKGIPVFYGNQWDNTDNAKSHENTTGPEIFHQLAAQGLTVDAFNCAIGTGGSIVGTSRGLRKLNPNVKIAISDPKGAMPTTFYNTGELKMGQGSSIVEGVGQSRITGNLGLEQWKPDLAFDVDDTIAMETLNRLTYEEGLQVGLSSGLNVAGSIELAKRLGPGHNIVTLLCDLGPGKYNSKMYNLPFLRSKALPVPYWMDDAIINGTADMKQRVEEFKIPNDVAILSDFINDTDLKVLVDEAKNSVEM